MGIIFQLGRWALSRPRLHPPRSDEGLEMHDGDTVHIQGDWDDNGSLKSWDCQDSSDNAKIGVVFRK